MNTVALIVSYCPFVIAAVVPFLFVFLGGSLGRGVLISWLLLVAGYGVLTFGVPALGGIEATNWVPESITMVPIIFLGLPFALVVVAVAGLSRLLILWWRSRHSEERK